MDSLEVPRNYLRDVCCILAPPFSQEYGGLKGGLWAQGGTCIIVGDDGPQVAALSDLAAKKLGCRIYIPHPYHPKGGHSQEKFNDQPLPQRCTQTIQLLADMEILAHADYMVGSYNSGIPGLVEILRYALYKKSRLTFADASSFHRDWAQGIRHYLKAAGV